MTTVRVPVYRFVTLKVIKKGTVFENYLCSSSRWNRLPTTLL